MTVNKQLLEMLRVRRPHGSRSERQWIARHIDSLSGIQVDPFGNRYLAIGSHPSTLISCHTDTVHETAGYQGLTVSKTGVVGVARPKKPKLVAYKSSKGMVYRHVRDCLGADDGAGCYAALRMIAAKVPALYVFHRAEEVGGLGSEFIADHRSGLLWTIERAIALDRKGTTDVITHQMMGRCCSEAFAWTLAIDLALDYSPCPLGTFTDTANYTGLVPECTNLSVGYYSEHSDRETLNTAHLETLIDRLCSIDLNSLPTVREPGTYEDYRYAKQSPAESLQANGFTSGRAEDYYDNWAWPSSDDAPMGLSEDTDSLANGDWCTRHSMRDCWKCDVASFNEFEGKLRGNQ